MRIILVFILCLLLQACELSPEKESEYQARAIIISDLAIEVAEEAVYYEIIKSNEVSDDFKQAAQIRDLTQKAKIDSLIATARTYEWVQEHPEFIAIIDRLETKSNDIHSAIQDWK